MALASARLLRLLQRHLLGPEMGQHQRHEVCLPESQQIVPVLRGQPLPALVVSVAVACCFLGPAGLLDVFALPEVPVLLGCDYFSMVLSHCSFQNQLLPRVFDGFLKRRIPRKNGEGSHRVVPGAIVVVQTAESKSTG